MTTTYLQHTTGSHTTQPNALMYNQALFSFTFLTTRFLKIRRDKFLKSSYASKTSMTANVATSVANHAAPIRNPNDHPRFSTPRSDLPASTKPPLYFFTTAAIRTDGSGCHVRRFSPYMPAWRNTPSGGEGISLWSIPVAAIAPPV